MKYRIKIITYANGRKEYLPQYKTRFMWLGISCDGKADVYDYVRDTREEALDSIDKHFAGNTKPQTIIFEYIDKP